MYDTLSAEIGRSLILSQARKINSHRWFFNAFAPLLAVRWQLHQTLPYLVDGRNSQIYAFFWTSALVPHPSRYITFGKRLI